MTAHPPAHATDVTAADTTIQLSVIVPARNCPGVLQACLEGLSRSTLPRTAWELLVVDDCSTDTETVAVAARVADRVLPTQVDTSRGPLGPGAARNVAAAVARAPILLFVDSDVVVAPETLAGFVAAFAAHPDVACIFGAYDTTPAAPGVVSQYRNLLHHYVHVTNPGDARTFWAGCGAVRRAPFLAVGGFDGARYPRPQIEDIELGMRLHAAGHRLLLLPHLQGKHLKRWSFANMVRTDFRERAVPWMYLVLEQGELLHDGALNLQRLEKLRALATAMALPLLAWAAIAGDARPAIVALLLMGFTLWGNRRLLAWFARERGLLFALAVVPLRLTYYVLSVYGAAWAMLTHRSVPARTALPPLVGDRDSIAGPDFRLSVPR